VKKFTRIRIKMEKEN
jgi:hypothetical protein